MKSKETQKEYYKRWSQTVKGKESLAKASLKYRQSERGKKKRNRNNNKYRSTVHGHIQHLWSCIKWRCEKKEIVFDLTVDFLEELWEKQDGKCAITGEIMACSKGIGRPGYTGSLDRIDPKAGYTKTNVRFLCDTVNMMKNVYTDNELENWCISIVEGLRGSKNRPISNYSTFADAVDRLIVELMKLSFFEQSKRDEQGKEIPDPIKVAMYDDLSRDACEYRSALKNKINESLQEIVRTKSYSPLLEIRTFRPPKTTVDEILEEMIENNLELKQELIDTIEYALEDELKHE